MPSAALPIPDAEALVAYAVVGSTVGPFAISFPLPVDWQGSLRCKVGEIELAAGQFLFSPDSAVASGFPSGAVTLVSAVAATTVTLWRDVPVFRTSDFGAGPLDFDAFNAELARVSMQLQDVRLANLLSGTAGIVSPALIPAVSADTVEEALSVLNGVLEVATLAAAKALTAGVVDAVVVRARATAGDGYAGLFVWRSGDRSANITADPASALWISPDSDTDGSSGAWQREYDGPIEDTWFAPVADGATDDLTPLTRFIDAVMASEHRRGVLRHKSYAISGALPQINVSGVQIVGTGTSSLHSVGSGIVGTEIKAITNSGFVMLTVAPTEGASARRLDAIKVLGLTLECNSLASKGLLVKSTTRSVFDVTAREATAYGVDLDVATTLGESADTQRNVFRFTGRQFDNDVPAIRVGGTTAANVSFNRFEFVDVSHFDATGIVVENADNNVWEDVRVFNPGGGSATYSVDFKGTDTSPGSARHEIIELLSTTLPAVVRGFASATTPATDILIECLDISNGTPEPVVEAGGTARWGTTRAGELREPDYNLIVNGDFALNQLAPATNADKTAGFDGGVVLTQTGTIALSSQSTPETGQAQCLRMTQSQAAAQRMGYLFVIPSQDTIPLRGKGVALAARIRHSVSADIRCAILEWTGTADAVAGDIVADWTSATYTTAGFFESTTKNVLAAMETPTAAATWRHLSGSFNIGGGLTATVGASATNLIVFIWTEGTAAQNVTLDIGRVRLLRGYMPDVDFSVEPIAVAIERAERQVFKTYSLATQPATSTAVGARHANSQGSVQQSRWWTPFRTRMRATPTATVYSQTGASGNVRDVTAGADIAASTTGAGETGVSVFPTVNTNDTNIITYHLVATAYPWL